MPRHVVAPTAAPVSSEELARQFGAMLDSVGITGPARARVLELDDSLKLAMLRGHEQLQTMPSGGVVPAAPEDKAQMETDDPSGITILFGRRGFCLHSEDGSNAYAAVPEVYAILVRAAQGNPNRALHEAAAAQAPALAEIMLKIGGGLDEGEAARRMMALIGEPMKVAVQLAVNASRTQERVQRAMRRMNPKADKKQPPSSHARTSKRSRASIAEADESDDDEPQPQPQKRVSRREPPQKRVSGREPPEVTLGRRRSSTGLSSGFGQLKVTPAAPVPPPPAPTPAIAAAPASKPKGGGTHDELKAKADALKVKAEAKAKEEAKAREAACAKAKAEAAAAKMVPPGKETEVSRWLDRKMLGACKTGLASIGATKLIDLANMPPNDIRDALKATAVN
jgi:hypothetical protein